MICLLTRAVFLPRLAAEWTIGATANSIVSHHKIAWGPNLAAGTAWAVSFIGYSGYVYTLRMEGVKAEEASQGIQPSRGRIESLLILAFRHRHRLPEASS